MHQLNIRLVKWARKKFGFPTRDQAQAWLVRINVRRERLFHHWSIGFCVKTCLFRRAV